MIPIKIDNNEFEIPGSWDEVTVRQFHEMVQAGDDLGPVRILSIFTGIDYDTLNNFDCTGFVENVLPLLGFIKEPIELTKLPRKKFIHLSGKEIPVIENPAKETIGQKLLLQELLGKLEDNSESITSVMADVVANYYAPKLRDSGIWFEDHVNEVAKDVWQMPITEAAPEVNFFLLGYMRG